MTMADARFLAGADALADWRDDLLSGRKPTLYPAGTGALANVQIGPGLVTLIGGAPGVGKTSIVVQMTFDALRLTPTLRALVCNVEMSPQALLDRQLARLSGLSLNVIRHRELTADHASRLDAGLTTLVPLLDRLAFLRPPFDLVNVAAAADAVEAGLIVLDYVQRIAPPGEHRDRRVAVDAAMSYLRQFADAGIAVLAVSAVGRSRDARGRSTYSELGLASFRESSEMEFGSDDAYILQPDEDDPQTVVLRHLKSRYGEPSDITLSFDRPLQRFTPIDPPASRADAGRLRSALAALWARTAPANDDEDDS
jgi:replicative DNA helicase